VTRDAARIRRRLLSIMATDEYWHDRNHSCLSTFEHFCCLPGLFYRGWARPSQWQKPADPAAAAGRLPLSRLSLPVPSKQVSIASIRFAKERLERAVRLDCTAPIALAVPPIHRGVTSSRDVPLKGIVGWYPAQRKVTLPKRTPTRPYVGTGLKSASTRVRPGMVSRVAAGVPPPHPA
jgi:hypothetical protein